MAWSHALLTEPERVFSRRLAVFLVSFTLGAAATICIPPPAGQAGNAVDVSVGHAALP